MRIRDPASLREALCYDFTPMTGRRERDVTGPLLTLNASWKKGSTISLKARKGRKS